MWGLILLCPPRHGSKLCPVYPLSCQSGNLPPDPDHLALSTGQRAGADLLPVGQSQGASWGQEDICLHPPLP